MLVLAAPAAGQTGTVSGKVTDPQFDTTPQESHYGNDLKSVEMTYDADAGTLRGVVENYGFVGPDGESFPWFWFYADLGRAQPDGSCDASATGSLLTSFYTADDRPLPSPPPSARVIGGPQLTGVLEEIYGPTGQFDTKIYTFDDSALVGLALDCVTHIELDSVYGTTDVGTTFCMSPTGRITCPVTVTPSPTPTPTPTPTPVASVIVGPGPTPPVPIPPAAQPDAVAPALTLAVRHAQHIGRDRTLSVTAGCGAEPCRVTAKGTISMPGAAAVRPLRTARADLAAGAKTTLRLKVSRRTLALVRRAVRGGRTVRAHLTITAVDAAGNRTTRAGTIRVR
jgi:hypothetical protein